MDGAVGLFVMLLGDEIKWPTTTVSVPHRCNKVSRLWQAHVNCRDALTQPQPRVKVHGTFGEECPSVSRSSVW